MTELDVYRQKIDEIDKQLLELFHKRMDIANGIGEYKRKNSLPIEDKEREANVIASRANGDTLDTAFLNCVMELSKSKQRSALNIYIIGMPYSGKSTFLHRLSKYTDRDCIDMDSIIEQQSGMSIAEIFEHEGETAFREAESALLKIIAGEGSLIVATGGGIIKSDENLRIMKHSGLVVLCDRPLEKLKATYEQDKDETRPLVRSVEDLEILYFERFKAYREAADIVVDPERLDAVHKVLELLQ